jgi:hypothetical protein
MRTINSDITRDGLDSIIEQLEALPVFPSLVWLWAWDVIKSQYESEDLNAVWEKFFYEAGDEGWTMEYGSEHMSEHVQEWLIRNNFITEEEDSE